MAKSGREEVSINILDPTKTALNKGLSQKLVHKVSDIVEGKAHRGTKKLKESVTKKSHWSIDSLAPSRNISLSDIIEQVP